MVGMWCLPGIKTTLKVAKRYASDFVSLGLSSKDITYILLGNMISHPMYAGYPTLMLERNKKQTHAWDIRAMLIQPHTQAR